MSVAPRKRAKTTRVINKSYKRRPLKGSFATKVMSVVNRKAEVKTQYVEFCDNTDLHHNVLQNINTQFITIPIGTASEAQGRSTGCRIGNTIFLKGVHFRCIIESQQYRPNCDYWIFLVRNKKAGATAITSSIMYEGLTTQLPTDFIDKEEVEVIMTKKISPRWPGTAVDNAMNTTGTGGISDGNAHPTSSDTSSQPNPKKIVNWYVPFNKKIRFSDGSTSAVESQTYQLCIMSYNNDSTITNGGTWPCGHIWLGTKFMFTDV